MEKYSFVGVGKATSKKEAQTQAARRFAEYLVRIGEIQNSELPSKQQSGTVRFIDGRQSRSSFISIAVWMWPEDGIFLAAVSNVFVTLHNPFENIFLAII